MRGRWGELMHQPSRMGLPFVPAAGLPDWPPAAAVPVIVFRRSCWTACASWPETLTTPSGATTRYASQPASSRPAGVHPSPWHACMHAWGHLTAPSASAAAVVTPGGMSWWLAG